VIGNALDRGLGYTPYGEHTRNLSASRSCFRRRPGTHRDGAMRLASWQLHKYGYGPAWDQLFVQSNFGIVTKAGMWLMPQPEIIRGFDVEMDRMEDLGPLIDAIGPLRREGVLRSLRPSATGSVPPISSPRASNGRTSPARCPTM